MRNCNDNETTLCDDFLVLKVTQEDGHLNFYRDLHHYRWKFLPQEENTYDTFISTRIYG